MLAKHDWFEPWFEAGSSGTPASRRGSRACGRGSSTACRTSLGPRAAPRPDDGRTAGTTSSSRRPFLTGVGGRARPRRAAGVPRRRVRPSTLLQGHVRAVEAEEEAAPDEATFYRTSRDVPVRPDRRSPCRARSGRTSTDLRSFVPPRRRASSTTAAASAPTACGCSTDGYRVEFADFDNPSTEYLRWRLDRRGSRRAGLRPRARRDPRRVRRRLLDRRHRARRRPVRLPRRARAARRRRHGQPARARSRTTPTSTSRCRSPALLDHMASTGHPPLPPLLRPLAPRRVPHEAPGLAGPHPQRPATALRPADAHQRLQPSELAANSRAYAPAVQLPPIRRPRRRGGRRRCASRRGGRTRGRRRWWRGRGRARSPRRRRGPRTRRRRARTGRRCGRAGRAPATRRCSRRRSGCRTPAPRPARGRTCRSATAGRTSTPARSGRAGRRGCRYRAGRCAAAAPGGAAASSADASPGPLSCSRTSGTASATSGSASSRVATPLRGSSMAPEYRIVGSGVRAGAGTNREVSTPPGMSTPSRP